MIIVSQDKETIVNFNNISIITQVDGRIGVTSDATNFTVSAIGAYKTEERAKEVLQKLIQSYREYRTAEIDGYINVLEETAVFEMPKE